MPLLATYYRLDQQFHETSLSSFSFFLSSFYGSLIILLIVADQFLLRKSDTDLRFSLFLFSLTFLTILTIHITRAYMRLVIPSKWGKILNEFLQQDGILDLITFNESGIDTLRQHDWRFDLAYSKAGLGERVNSSKNDFPWQVRAFPGLTSLKSLFWWTIPRLETACLLFATSFGLSWFGYSYASLILTALTFFGTIYFLNKLLSNLNKKSDLTTKKRQLYHDLLGLKFVTSLNMEDAKRLIETVKASNKEGTNFFLHKILNEVFKGLNENEISPTIDQFIVPILEKNFGSPLPKHLREAINCFKEKNN